MHLFQCRKDIGIGEQMRDRVIASDDEVKFPTMVGMAGAHVAHKKS